MTTQPGSSSTTSSAPLARNRVRKLVHGLAIGSFVLSLVAAGILVWSLATLGIGHVASASMIAITLFLASCGVVLYVMGMPPRKPDPAGDNAP